MSLPPPSHGPDTLDIYLKLFEPYEQQLSDFDGREGDFGHRFALLFRQAVRLLVVEEPFNTDIPKLFIEVAQRFLSNDPETVRHFSYEENRHFFLSDLYDWLNRHQLGRNLRLVSTD